MGNILSSKIDRNRENTADVMVKCLLMCSYQSQPAFFFFWFFTDSQQQTYLYNTKTQRMYNDITAKKQDTKFSMQMYIKI